MYLLALPLSGLLGVLTRHTIISETIGNVGVRSRMDCEQSGIVLRKFSKGKH